jgi:hypothetical protein
VVVVVVVVVVEMVEEEAKTNVCNRTMVLFFAALRGAPTSSPPRGFCAALRPLAEGGMSRPPLPSACSSRVRGSPPRQ